MADDRHIFFLEAAAGGSRCAHTDTAGDEGALRIVRDGVFVDGDVNVVEAFFPVPCL